jgi:exopolysaccharide biosynthesis polyprenyl glycosylphosphotransferase
LAALNANPDALLRDETRGGLVTRNRSLLLNYAPLVAAVDLATLYTCSWATLAAGLRVVGERVAWRHLDPIELAAALMTFWGFGLYRSWSRRPLADTFVLVAAAGVVLAMVWGVLALWEPQFAISNAEIAGLVLPQTLGIALERGVLRALILRHERAGQVAIVATDEFSANQILRKLLSSAPAEFSVDVCLTVEQFHACSDEEIVWHSLLLAPDIADKASIIRRATRLGVKALLLLNDFEIFLNGARLHSVDDLLMAQVSPLSLHPVQRILKRGLDVVGSTLLLALSAPVMVIVAGLLRLTSRGDVLFRQTRVGRHGVEFMLYKFRTMVADAEQHTGPVLATVNDPRITPFGAFLRASRLDELPQLLNVLRGDMSLVGPRPERPHFVRQFCEELPGYEFRLAVKPGITGFAQVCGSYSTTALRKLRFDLVYIANYSLLTDLRILLVTIAVLFRRRQAEGVAAVQPAKAPGAGACQ